jgi:hypothetical protein
MEDLKIVEERPFKFDVKLNSNSESEDKNHLKLKLTFELPENYPHQVPSIRIKNLCKDIIDNNMILDFEKIVLTKAEESIGNLMIYDICDAIKE